MPTFILSQTNEIYIVEKGDTYFSVARKLGINYIDLAKINDNKRLRSGEPIQIPTWKIYTIQKGDTFYSISIKLKVKIIELKASNPGVEILKTGETIKIPSENGTGSLEKMVWPTSGKLLQPYGENRSIMNYGIQILSDRKKVVAADFGTAFIVEEIRGLGLTIIVKHTNETYTVYSGMKESYVKPGELIKKKGVLGTLSNNILFFAISYGGSLTDPISHLPPRGRP